MDTTKVTKTARKSGNLNSKISRDIPSLPCPIPIGQFYYTDNKRFDYSFYLLVLE